jgi:hypothetical protein
MSGVWSPDSSGNPLNANSLYLNTLKLSSSNRMSQFCFSLISSLVAINGANKRTFYEIFSKPLREQSDLISKSK